MNIDPTTGLDLDDPEVQAMRRMQAQAVPAAAAPLLAINRDSPVAPTPDRPAGLPALGVGIPSVAPAATSPALTPPPAATTPASPMPLPAPLPKSGLKPPSPAGPSAEQKRIAGINAGEVAAAQDLGTANAARAGAIAQGKQDEVTLREKQAADEQTRLNARLAEKTKVDAQAAADADAAKKAGFRGYWADKSTGTKILAAISVALSGAGQAFQAKAGRPMGDNGALKIINDAIAMDWQKQQATIAKLEHEAASSGARREHIEAEVGLMQAAARKNGLDLAIAQAEQRAAALGPQVAQAAAGGVIAGLRREQFDAEKKLEVQKAQVAEMRAGTTLKYAEANKANAEAGKANEPATQGRGITDARQRAMLATGLSDQDRIAKALEVKGVQLTEQDLQRIQDNRTYLKAAAEGHGAGDAYKTVLLRRWGAIPRNEFDGLSPEKKQLAGAKELMSQKAALLAAGSQTSEAINHARGMVDLLAPGLGAQEQGRRRQYIRSDLIGANVGLVPGEVAKAQAGAAAAGEGIAAPPRISPEEKTRMIQFIRQNPNDPKAARARQILGIGGAPVAGL